MIRKSNPSHEDRQSCEKKAVFQWKKKFVNQMDFKHR